MDNSIQINTINGYEEVKDVYYCNKMGEIWSKKTNKKLQGTVDKDGYLVVNLRLKNEKAKKFKIHRIVCSAFHENIDNKPTVNHINHIRNDNRAENLQWATYKEQLDNVCIKNISKKHSKKVFAKHTKEHKVMVFKSIKQCADYLGITPQSIGQSIKNNWKCKGFRLYIKD